MRTSDFKLLPFTASSEVGAEIDVFTLIVVCLVKSLNIFVF